MTLDELLTATEGALGVVASAGALGLVNPAVPMGAELLAKLLRVVQAGIKAHEAVTGQPLDLSRLHDVVPLPLPSG